MGRASRANPKSWENLTPEQRRATVENNIAERMRKEILERMNRARLVEAFLRGRKRRGIISGAIDGMKKEAPAEAQS